MGEGERDTREEREGEENSPPFVRIGLRAAGGEATLMDLGEWKGRRLSPWKWGRGEERQG
eukprot:scaffold61349_cov39-Tisochrysis_lutea.AAC.3